MIKKLKLKPSQRENKRYFLLDKAERKDIEKAILDYVGILGWAKASPFFVKSDIIAVNRKEIEKIKAALALAGICVRRVSGTLKGLRT